jgi:hypothetical protein
VLGFNPIASDPFAAAGAGAIFSGEIAESATISELVSALAVFVGVDLESSQAADSTTVTASIFSAAAAESATASDSLIALLIFNAAVAELSQIQDSTTVEASTFGASISEQATGLDTFFTNVAFLASISETATIADALLAKFLWELINDQQSINWINIYAAQNANWGQTDTSTPNTWTDIPTTS